jgi:hypothetical protein
VKKALILLVTAAVCVLGLTTAYAYGIYPLIAAIDGDVSGVALAIIALSILILIAVIVYGWAGVVLAARPSQPGAHQSRDTP